MRIGNLKTTIGKILNPLLTNKKRILSTLKIIGIIAVLLIVLALVVDKLLMPVYTRHGTEFPLPDMVGKSFDEAMEIADKYKFEIIIRGEQPSPNTPEGTILSQVPAAGTAIKENRKIKVIVSSGVQMVEVPDLTRFSIRQAELKLPEIELKVRNYYWTESDRLAKDVIAYTVPPAGALVPKGGGIDLYINRGIESDEGYVPKLLGKSLEDALKMIDTLGFPKPRVEYVTNPMLLPRIVTYQHPSAGTKVKIDSTQIYLVLPVEE